MSSKRFLKALEWVLRGAFKPGGRLLLRLLRGCWRFAICIWSGRPPEAGPRGASCGNGLRGCTAFVRSEGCQAMASFDRTMAAVALQLAVKQLAVKHLSDR